MRGFTIRRAALFILALFSCWTCVQTAPVPPVRADPSASAASPAAPLPDWALGGFVRPAGVNPIISPDPVPTFFDPMSQKADTWESDNTFNPAAVVKDGKIVVLYRAEDDSGQGVGNHTSRIGMAVSGNGLNFKTFPAPVLYPADDAAKPYEWPGGCEDPRVAVTENGTSVILYTAWNHQAPQLSVALSKDLIHWTKYGPVFRTALSGKFAGLDCKSASIVTQIIHNRQVIAKVNGSYFMYWGEDHVHAATSNDLIHWTPLVDTDGSIRNLASPRPGFFDSSLDECGPPALITKNGILLLYNGKNDFGSGGDRRYPAGAYCAGEMLFSLKDPTRVLHRLDVPFLHPTEPYEKSGQYVDGTVFIEGLVFFQEKWFLYYGTADSHVAVAVYDPRHPALPDPVPQDTGP